MAGGRIRQTACQWIKDGIKRRDERTARTDVMLTKFVVEVIQHMAG